MTHRKSLVIGGMLLGVILLSGHLASASVIGILAGRDLSAGSTGADVADLQGLLSEQGFLQVPIGVP